ncbi:hypothetical protein [Natrinema caseinilyticum]|uniref:hypothetical protein n=1 Tax=Natrinema caseinilyticum TaxID=2961570 RepID=UPI0020C4E5AD|nr:hypothetical protein [Natrinema caseinilyticum]
MTWVATAAFGVFAAGTGAFVYLLVANLDPQPEYPELMTDLLGLIGTVIAVCGAAIGAAFLVAAVNAYPG